MFRILVSIIYSSLEKSRIPRLSIAEKLQSVLGDDSKVREFHLPPEKIPIKKLIRSWGGGGVEERGSEIDKFATPSRYRTWSMGVEKKRKSALLSRQKGAEFRKSWRKFLYFIADFI